MQKEVKPHLIPSQFIEKCRGLFGESDPHWRKMFCKVTGCTEASVSRYAAGKQPIPLTVANLLFALELLVYYEDDIIDSFGLGVER